MLSATVVSMSLSFLTKLNHSRHISPCSVTGLQILQWMFAVSERILEKMSNKKKKKKMVSVVLWYECQ